MWLIPSRERNFYYPVWSNLILYNNDVEKEVWNCYKSLERGRYKLLLTIDTQYYSTIKAVEIARSFFSTLFNDEEINNGKCYLLFIIFLFMWIHLKKIPAKTQHFLKINLTIKLLCFGLQFKTNRYFEKNY